MTIEEFQTLTSFILQMIRQILGECFYKRDFSQRVLNEVLNVISNHDFICLSSETLDIDFSQHVLIKYQIQNIRHRFCIGHNF